MIRLGHYGIRGTTQRCICTFLTNRSQQVLVEGAISGSIPVGSGVPQGTVLGPLLFSLFIKDLPDSIQSRTQLFADDCILYRRIKSQQDCDILQDHLNLLTSWEKKWGMAFHPDKCSTIRISRSRKPIKRDYSVKGHVLTTNNSTRCQCRVSIQHSLE